MQKVKIINISKRNWKHKYRYKLYASIWIKVHPYIPSTTGINTQKHNDMMQTGAILHNEYFSKFILLAGLYWMQEYFSHSTTVLMYLIWLLLLQLLLVTVDLCPRVQPRGVIAVSKLSCYHTLCNLRSFLPVGIKLSSLMTDELHE